MNKNNLIEKVKFYKCDYCGKLYETIEETIKCLNNHNIVFRIKQLKTDHDCWGNSNCYWNSTNKLFKDYKKALEYIDKNKDCKIVYEELC